MVEYAVYTAWNFWAARSSWRGPSHSSSRKFETLASAKAPVGRCARDRLDPKVISTLEVMMLRVRTSLKFSLPEIDGRSPRTVIFADGGDRR
ncbi:hypothetical protein [Rhizobium sp. SL42]|uniref:hypothetical protein n=1 Tax=Rhizobium sp. SL42 TaxID=2806346 RepID=UPI001F2A6BD4|nr:hypothetical protein [Rhizobium sp. SL42]UJW76094.1 hypothetical protein IM739_06315 [Rhizobium sp. SL42]